MIQQEYKKSLVAALEDQSFANMNGNSISRPLQPRVAKHGQEKEVREKELEVLMEWVTERLSSQAQVPRVSDVVHYAYTVLGFKSLKKAAIARRLRLHPAYIKNSSQTRGYSRWKRYRPIIANTLGMLHGDLGYFSKSRDFETPVSYRAGYLVLKDVVSRFTYVAILYKNKSAESMIRAFKEILQFHENVFGPQGHKIKSISFDRETSVLSNKVQAFLRDNHIDFHAFKYSASKSKHAEGAIRLIRTTMARYLSAHPGARWWQSLAQVRDILNKQPIRIRGKQTEWRPIDINAATLGQFVRQVLKIDPVQYFGQFDFDPRQVQFKFPVGSFVRPKLLVTSSAVIGEKRSEINLEADPFVVEEHLAYANARYEVGRAYRCINLRTREEEVFDESDLAESTSDFF